LPPLPKSTPTPPPKYTGIAKFGPQPYNKPVVGDAQTILSHKKFSRNSVSDGLVFTAECTVRSSPSPQLYRKDKPPELANDKLLIEEPEEATVSMESVTNVIREQSLTPDNQMEITFHEENNRCMSLEPDLSRDMEVISPCLEDSGRRSTQGIPEVERNVKFSQPDTRNGKKKSDNQTEGSGTKNRSKSSTLSLHAVAGSSSSDKEEEPPLQRRNSIHNVPYVDVNDPDTRTRMERYKEERRSMLRAKYKAEDYLSSSFSRKKKLSTNSSQDSSESELPQNSPDIDVANTRQPQFCTSLATDRKHSSPTNNVSTTFLNLKQPEQEQSFISQAFVPELKNEVFYKTEVAVASVQKKSSLPMNFNKSVAAPRPDQLTISKSENSKENFKNLINSPISDMEESNKRQSSHSSSEENVNVKERASIFGPRKFSETKVRTVSAPVATKSGTEGATITNMNVSKQNKYNSQSSNQTSPSKIKNMAAMFEQKH